MIGGWVNTHRGWASPLDVATISIIIIMDSEITRYCYFASYVFSPFRPKESKGISLKVPRPPKKLTGKPIKKNLEI